MTAWRDAQKDPPPYGEWVYAAWSDRDGGPYSDMLVRDRSDAKGEWYGRADNTMEDVLAHAWMRLPEPVDEAPLPAPPETAS